MAEEDILPTKAELLSGTDEKPKTISFTHGEIGEFKKKQRDAGVKAEAKRRESQAIELGFSSYEEMIDWTKSTRKNEAMQPDPEPEPTPTPKPRQTRAPKSETVRPDGDQTVSETLDSALKHKFDALSEQYKTSEITRQEMKEEMDVAQSRHELALIAVQCGIDVADTDYAIDYLIKSTENLSEEELDAFDEEKYFRETLREKKPFLYRDVVQTLPANTGAGARVNAPSAEDALKQQASNSGPKRVRDMDEKEFKEHLRKNYPGLDPNRVSDHR